MPEDHHRATPQTPRGGMGRGIHRGGYGGGGLNWTMVNIFIIQVFIINVKNMNADLLNQHDSNTIVTAKFIRLNGFFLIDSPCIFCTKKIVRVNDCYDLILFLDDGGIGLRNVQFRTATLKNDVLTIIVHDTKSNREHYFTQPFNDTSACSWLLIEKNYFNEELQGLGF